MPFLNSINTDISFFFLSIMAGFAAQGIQDNTIINIKTIMENRGVSYGGGGDAGAVTVPNFIKKYSPKLKGPSVSDHLAEICFGPLCPPLQCTIMDKYIYFQLY